MWDMGTYEQSADMSVSPDRLFAYLAEVDHLPEYMPRITQAHAVDGGDAVDVTAEIDPPDAPAQTVHGQAWLRVQEEGRSLAWGSEGDNNSSGELDVEPASAGSRLTVRLHTERTEGEQIDASLREVLDKVKELVEDEGVA